MYEDAQVIDLTTVKPQWTIMSVAGSYIQNDPYLSARQLQPAWREPNKTQILSYEANARIQAVFPDYSQRNANNEMNGYITTYGANSASWPSAQQSRKAEMDRCWTYVSAVRASANNAGNVALPADPTDDSHWPTRVPAYVPGP
jgi:hypothetical protein